MLPSKGTEGSKNDGNSESTPGRKQSYEEDWPLFNEKLDLLRSSSEAEFSEFDGVGRENGSKTSRPEGD